MGKIKIVRSIREVPRKAWDDLATDNILASHGWLKTVEETNLFDLTPYYLLMEEEGEVIAGSVGYRIGGKYASLAMDAVLFGRLERYAKFIGISFNPHMLCRPFRSTGTHILLHRDLSRESAINAIEEILFVLENEAFRQRLALVFSGIMDRESELMEVLSLRGYHRTFSYPVNIVDLNFTSFEEYLRSLDSFSPNSRKVVRREMNKNRKEGVVIEEVENPEDYGDRLYDLLCGNNDKYRSEPFPYNKNFLSSLKNNLGEEATIYAARKNGSVTGISVDFHRGGTQYNPYVGVDHELAGNDFTYFNMAYYESVRHAIARGVRRLNWGSAFHDVKSRRGARRNNCYIYYKSPNKMRHFMAGLWFKLHAFWWRKKLTKLNISRPAPTINENAAESAEDGQG